jgi:tRNA threonylcarbamoyladenosine biosynthesis protein TsaB
VVFGLTFEETNERTKGRRTKHIQRPWGGLGQVARHKLLTMSSAPPPVQAQLLAFDTSTEQLAVAVQAANQSCVLNAAGGAVASATLLPHIHGLMAQAGLVFKDLHSIAFGMGPGAFTGLRTACAVAQGLGWGLNIGLLPIDSLLIVAEDARAQAASSANNTSGAADLSSFDIGVAMDARMDEVYAGRYRWCGGHWQVLVPPALYSLPALADAWSAQAFHALAGSALNAFGDRLPLPPATRFTGEHNRAAALLRLAVQAAQMGPGIDPAQALPLYLRDKVAHTTREREAQREAQRESLREAPRQTPSATAA